MEFVFKLDDKGEPVSGDWLPLEGWIH